MHSHRVRLMIMVMVWLLLLERGTRSDWQTWAGPLVADPTALPQPASYNTRLPTPTPGPTSLPVVTSAPTSSLVPTGGPDSPPLPTSEHPLVGRRPTLLPPTPEPEVTAQIPVSPPLYPTVASTNPRVVTTPVESDWPAPGEPVVTATSFPTGTSTTAWTPTPTPVATGVPTRTIGAVSTASGAYVSIFVQAWHDAAGVGPDRRCPGCDGFFTGGDSVAEMFDRLPNVDIAVRDAATGELLDQKRTVRPIAINPEFAHFMVPLRDAYMIELLEVPDGWTLCPNSPQQRWVPARWFQASTTFVKFTFWRGCAREITPPPTVTPTGTPVPPTVTPTSIPPTVTQTVTPVPTATETPGPVFTPTETALPTATATGTPSPSPTPTQTVTAIATETETPLSSPTPTATATETETPLPSPTTTETTTPRITETATPTPTATDTLPPTSTPTVTPTSTPTATLTTTPTSTATVTPSPTPTRQQTPIVPDGPAPTPCPASLVVLKYLDADGNQRRDADEPVLSGWTFQVRLPGVEYDLTTGPDGTFKVEDLHGGDSLTLTERLDLQEPGWLPSGPVSRAITLGCGVNQLDFGNARLTLPETGGPAESDHADSSSLFQRASAILRSLLPRRLLDPGLVGRR